jgi:hypothetical protein
MGTITAAEREALHSLFRTLDQTTARPVTAEPTVFARRPELQKPDGGISPGDDYEARTDWTDILTPHGWRHVSTDGTGTRHWTRPGKSEGNSATTGNDASRDRLFVFSTSTEFEAQVPYTKFGAYALLNHGGNHSAAAATLRAAGYGTACTKPAHHPPSAERARQPVKPPERPPAKPMTLHRVHQVYKRWLGEDYDTDALDAVLAAAACNQLDGDPLWLLLLSGSGNAKTETVQALEGAGATITSTISSVGALLSATSTKEKTKDATGGLLRKLRPKGVLVIKDVTSILSMDRTARGEVPGCLPGNSRRALVPQRRHRRRTHPQLGRAPDHHRRRHHRLGPRA